MDRDNMSNEEVMENSEVYEEAVTDEQVRKATTDTVKDNLDLEDTSDTSTVLDALDDDVIKELFVATNELKKESVLKTAEDAILKLTEKGTSDKNIIEYVSQTTGMSLRESWDMVVTVRADNRKEKGFVEKLYDTLN